MDDHPHAIDNAIDQTEQELFISTMSDEALEKAACGTSGAQTYPQTCVATICVGDSLFPKKLSGQSRNAHPYALWKNLDRHDTTHQLHFHNKPTVTRFILRCNTTNKMCTGKDQQVLYRALDVQRLLVLQDVIRSLLSEVERAGSQRTFERKARVNVVSSQKH